MSYADIAGRRESPGIDLSTLPEEVRLAFPQLPERVRDLIAIGDIRIEIRENDEGKTILLIHDDPSSPERMAERLGKIMMETKKLIPTEERIARRANRTKFEIQETIAPSIEPFKHDTPRTGRNEACPCGSGKKYKLCHLRKQSR